MSSPPVLVTGAAGFIGYHLAARLLQQGRQVVGFDNLYAYYDVRLKQTRLARLKALPGFTWVHADLSDRDKLAGVFDVHKFRLVVHLAAQAGVRYSLTNPQVYIDSNITGFLNILECCRHSGIDHLLYASSSSVYGGNTRMPFSVHDSVDHPVSLYAATKKANELMAHTYAHLFSIPSTGMRLFTVYGPWGRPDMATYLFAKSIVEGRAIDLFNHGQMRRDFTYVDDAVECMVRLLDKPPRPNAQYATDAADPAGSWAPYRVLNVGNHDSVELLRLVNVLEQELGKTADKRLLPMQPGDVPASFADVEDLKATIAFSPHTPIETGLKHFVRWFKEYEQIK